MSTLPQAPSDAPAPPAPGRPALIASRWFLGLVLLGLGLDFVFSPNEYEILVPAGLGTLFVAAFLFDWIWRLPPVGRIFRHVRDTWLDTVLTFTVTLVGLERCWVVYLGLSNREAEAAVEAAYRLFTAIFYLALLFKTFTGTARARSFFQSLGRSPSAMTAFTFAVFILVGALLLCLPQAVPTVNHISFVDALFIATSATCVTGLASVDIGTWYSSFGHVVIMLLIQAGGLGIITMSVLVPMLAGRRLEVRAESTLKEILEADTLSEISRNIRLIFLFTFSIEAAGALILYANWSARGVVEGAGARLFSSVFHVVSAFCNAGFSLFANNLESFTGDWVTSLLIAGLIVVGGIGFPVLINLTGCARLWARGRRHRAKLSFHTKVVLTTTAALIVAGTLLILLFEWHNTLAALPAGDKVVAAIFQAITPRTAGFNTVPTGSMALVTLFIIIVLMFIGASPQSTGGGIKTTSFAVIVLTVRALLRRREHVEAFRRTLPPAIIYRVTALVFIAMCICGLALGGLLITESAQFVESLFEVVSAFGTVGLSMGITPKLTVVGKLIITLTMFVGRIGPLTLAVALAERPLAGRFRYPDDHVIIG